MLPTDPAPILLTARERDVFRLMAQGCSNEGIAQGLFLSVKTVECYITRLYAKLGLTDDPEIHRRVRAVNIWFTQRHELETRTLQAA